MPTPIILLTSSALVLVAGPPWAHAKVKVVATLPDLAAVAREVGGEAVDVTALAPSSTDPHDVDARPSLILPLNRADLFIMNGLGLEGGWLPRLLVNARNGKIHAGGAGHFDASLYVQAVDVPDGPVDRSMGDVHPGGNPHYTSDPRQAVRVAQALAEKLAQIDPERSRQYHDRATSFARELLEFSDAQAARFQALPEQRRQVVTYHRSMTYLVDWLGLKAVGALEPRPGIPPDPSHVANILAQVRSRRVAAIIQEEHHPRATSRTLAQLAGVRLVLLPTATRFAEGERYIEHMRRITEDLYDALHP